MRDDVETTWFTAILGRLAAVRPRTVTRSIKVEMVTVEAVRLRAQHGSEWTAGRLPHPAQYRAVPLGIPTGQNSNLTTIAQPNACNINGMTKSML